MTHTPTSAIATPSPVRAQHAAPQLGNLVIVTEQTARKRVHKNSPNKHAATERKNDH
jgi:hypothetical protein